MKRIAIVVVLALSGCSMLPMKRTESVKTAENIATAQNLMIQSVVKSRPVSTNAVFEESISVSHDSSSNAGAKENSRLALSLPVAVSLVLGALSVVLLGVGLWAVRRSSAVGQSADEGLAQSIRSVRAIVAGLGDDRAKAQLNELVAQVEASRGKLKK